MTLGLDLEVEPASKDEFLFQTRFKHSLERVPLSQKILIEGGPNQFNMSVLEMMISVSNSTMRQLAMAVETFSKSQ